MPHYRYKALKEDGTITRGQMYAEHESAVEARIFELGFETISISSSSFLEVGFSNKISSKDLSIICIQLEQLERAGVPLTESIGDIQDYKEDATIKSVFSDLYYQLRQGSLLSDAMRSHANIFDGVFIELVAAGEKTGRLADAFKHLSDHLIWVEDVKKQIKKATMYPLILFIVLMIVVTLMMIFAIPKLATFLTEQGLELPGYTQALI
ncbi:MAG: type II secretion system F family protein, partial [Pseudomonadota bacterium]